MMRLRSMLFVPGDSDRKFAKARDIGADALILDLEDSVAPSMKSRCPRESRLRCWTTIRRAIGSSSSAPIRLIPG